jgi:hypothetical protein
MLPWRSRASGGRTVRGVGLVERSQAGALPPEALRYRSTRLQRVLPVLPLLVVVMGTRIWEWVAGAQSGAEVARTSGTWAALLFVPLIMNRHFGITLSQSTAIVHNLRRRTIQWAEVQVIRIETVLGTRTVVIYEADGRRTSLRAPTTVFFPGIANSKRSSTTLAGGGWSTVERTGFLSRRPNHGGMHRRRPTGIHSLLPRVDGWPTRPFGRWSDFGVKMRADRLRSEPVFDEDLPGHPPTPRRQSGGDRGGHGPEVEGVRGGGQPGVPPDRRLTRADRRRAVRGQVFGLCSPGWGRKPRGCAGCYSGWCSGPPKSGLV